ncbi:hypothetical protein ACFVMC_06390 [Nocardia sp. NPDC127579]|uniref:hypothetical protein n=1 Tax=Nocardia sp. NPDC127579 TaxID=3345402 RepID=UPI003626BBE0
MSKDADTNKDAEITEKIEATDHADTEQTVEAETAAVTAQPDLSKKAADEPTVKVEKAEQAAAEPKKAKPKKEPKAAVPKAADYLGDSPRGSSNLVPIIAAFAAGILLVAAATAVTLFYLQASKKSDELAAVDAATKAACTFGNDVSTYDYSKDLEGYFAKVKSGATGDFLKEFDDATKALTDAMVQAQVKSWTDNVECGFQSGDTSTAKVLVTLAQYRTNFTKAEPDRQYVAIVADLEHTDGRWKVSKLDSPMLKGADSGLPGTAQAPQATTPAPAPGDQQPQPGN